MVGFSPSRSVILAIFEKRQVTRLLWGTPELSARARMQLSSTQLAFVKPHPSCVSAKKMSAFFPCNSSYMFAIT